MPFRDGEFGMITAFGSFHWFCDKVSVKEIQRVLKRDGIFCTINNKEEGDLWKKCIRRVVKNVAGRVPPSPAKGYRPLAILKRSGFSSIRKKVFRATERYSVPEALQYFQSMSIWNGIPPIHRPKVTRLLKQYLYSISEKGKIVRAVGFTVITGQKKGEG